MIAADDDLAEIYFLKFFAAESRSCYPGALRDDTYR
jgi:hypothetical protein